MRMVAALFLFGVWVSLPLHAEQREPHKKTYSVRHYSRHHAKGFKKSKGSDEKMRAMPHLSYMQELGAIPGKIDLSPLVSLPEDQGQCGCCWDFSLTKALRSSYMLAGIDPGQLEFNYLLDNCGSGPAMGGCNGGDFIAAQSFENGQGPGLNSLNPFAGYPKRCSDLPVQATAVSYAMLGEGKKGPTFKDLTYAMGVEKQMLSIDIAAGSGEWESYAGGVYNECVKGSIDHMVDLVGFDCGTSIDVQGNCVFDSTGRAIHHDELLLVENNWGGTKESGWGSQASNGYYGYMWTVMYDKNGNKCNGVATDALIFTIKKPAAKPIEQSKGFFCNLLGLWC